MQQFTPLSSLVGGALIGLAAAGMWILSGRIAGVSGMVSAALWRAGDRAWCLAFLAGLAGGGAAIRMLAPARFAPPGAGIEQLALAGLLVGLGTSLGNGCTSGHGVCGIGRLSLRSVVATGVFIAAGVLTVAALGRLGWS